MTLLKELTEPERYEEALGTCRLLVSQTREQRIAEIAQHGKAAVVSAPAEGDSEARAQQAEAGEDASSPDPARLREQSRSSAPGCTDSQDGSAG